MAMNSGLSNISVRLPAKLRRVFLGDPKAELRNTISDRLMVFGNALVHINSGRTSSLSKDFDSLQLAIAAKHLLDESHATAKIELLLAPSEFVATTQAMPGISDENLESALSLQQETLLPALDQELAMCASKKPSEENEDVVALWVAEQRLQELFDAFSKEGLQLVTIQPRVLAISKPDSVVELIEDEAEYLTAIRIDDGVITNWLQTEKSDLEQPQFAEQWAAEIAMLNNPVQIDSSNHDLYLQNHENQSQYLFFPHGALDARKRVEKGRQLLVAASVAAGVMLLAAIPFIYQSIEFRMANSQLQATREMSTDARSDQSIVVNFENQWGAINDYPNQELRAAMFKLQEVLGDERLSSLELSEGLVRIQGTSPDPQAILQRLEQDPMFTEVVFSRATNNTRYYIDLRLATVSFEAYMVRYFPDAS